MVEQHERAVAIARKSGPLDAAGRDDGENTAWGEEGRRQSESMSLNQLLPLDDASGRYRYTST